MADSLAQELLRVNIDCICQSLGWRVTGVSASEFLQQLTEKSYKKLGPLAAQYAKKKRRSVPTPKEFTLALNDLNAEITEEIKAYILPPNPRKRPRVCSVNDDFVFKKPNSNFVLRSKKRSNTSVCEDNRTRLPRQLTSVEMTESGMVIPHREGKVPVARLVTGG